MADGLVFPAGSVISAATVKTPSAGISAGGTVIVTTPAVISAALSTTVTSGIPSPSVSTSNVSPAAASAGSVISAVTPAAISAALSTPSPPSLILTVGALGGVESFRKLSVACVAGFPAASVTSAVIATTPSGSAARSATGTVTE